MVKRLVSAAVAAASVLVAGSALAADLIVEEAAPVAVADPGDWYISLFAGGTWIPDLDGTYYSNTYEVDTDMGYLLGVAVGTEVFDALRFEVELSGGSAGMTEVSDPDDLWDDFDGSVSTLYLLGNLWYDLNVDGGITPYIGGGLGLGHATLDFADWPWEVDGVGVAFQVGAGVKFQVADGIALDLGYRFKALPSMTLEDQDGYELNDVSIYSHVLQAGLTFSF